MGLSKPRRTTGWNPERYYFQSLDQDTDPDPVSCKYRTMHPTLYGGVSTMIAVNGGPVVPKSLKIETFQTCTRNFDNYEGVSNGKEFGEFGHAALQEEMFWHIFSESQIEEAVQSKSEPLSTGANGDGQRSTSLAPKNAKSEPKASTSTTMDLTQSPVEPDRVPAKSATDSGDSEIASFTPLRPTPAEASA